MEKEQDQFSLELDETIAEGVYCNLAIINHSNTEFVVDFVTIMPGMPKGKVKSRIVLTPQHAKRLMNALHENVQRYESSNGPIVDMEASSELSSIKFGTKGEA
ncbi:DUF3467 domain-containing protein [Myroides sp. M-43]|uniref:DUF3467 domain-containing protein n=1 Tax=Myroides oncorhynchi TaxID=2893756 RepID=UPI001E561847|nr:DUF3467 domain-containing protein [Myroides oncorhynchi]MCC9041701.1 DUF3467 domain-containing protein [Myroides oncorhynchi]